jgi:trehalose-6-phosphate synthase
MKVKGKDFEILKNVINTYIDNSRDLTQKRVNCEEQSPENGFNRFCWSILWRSMHYIRPGNPNKVICDLYDQGINDNNIQTALRIILKDFDHIKGDTAI